MDILLDNIGFAYESDPILRKISCRFKTGRFYAVLGPNGSGKTTLLDIISGFLTPSSGTVSIDRHPVQAFSKKDLSRKIALVSQDYAIHFPFLVKDVVLMGRHPFIGRFSRPDRRDHEKAAAVMERCGIRHLARRKINELSGGEKQRCVFARALCQDTPVLLLDEAFSNMDINHTLNMLNIIKASVKNENKTVISVFHDLNIAASWSDTALMLKKGEIRAFGSIQDVFTEKMIQNVFNVASIVEYHPHVNAKQIYYPAV